MAPWPLDSNRPCLGVTAGVNRAMGHGYGRIVLFDRVFVGFYVVFFWISRNVY